MTQRLVLTAVECMTAVGLDAPSSAAAVRAGISRLRASEQFVDVYGNPIVEACLPWLPAEEATDDPEESEAPADAEPDDGDDVDSEDASQLPDPEPVPEESEELDLYELARQIDEAERIGHASRTCFSRLLDAYTGSPPRPLPNTHVFLGVSPPSRPGPRFEGTVEEVARDLLRPLVGPSRRTELALIGKGNPAALHCLGLATVRLSQDPSAVCIVGGMDSLLSLATLNWYEERRRLRSGSGGRNHGLAPAEAVGFLVVETLEAASAGGRKPLAELAGVGWATDPAPFLSAEPSRGEGLTQACGAALAASGLAPGEIGSVYCDLDGEFHRSKEWALAETRCFGSAGTRSLIHPADCFGSVGSAFGVVLVALATVALSHAWSAKPVLVCCLDDAGECGAVVLKPIQPLERGR